ncbi:division/cell wall cluster transcriptional repressor MraZ [Candidatus Dojkabacteria bacterium]|uniref:Transcriptional regulator MraZ n=1 Tax=Candidatus Dojkabacteria bacterium TaxID=2099670 RepID=A0A955I6W4_9BACT|nr:division/cell wall cluster transcriptional repressor MraZ [Candidatus Dojkabacteria bacterium]
MLLGSYETKLTDKNRIAVPSKLRTELDENLILARGYEGCVLLLDKNRWDQLLAVIGKEPILNLSVRDTFRFIIAGAFEVDLDKQGRLVVPQSLREFAQIETDVIFLGMRDWVEIWDLDKWQQRLGKITKSADDIAEKLMKLNKSNA